MAVSFASLSSNSITKYNGKLHCLPARPLSALWAFYTGRYKSRTGSTRTASLGRINLDQLGSTRIVSDHEKNIKLNEIETFTYLKVKIPVKNGPN